jgi:hypothetical protein
MLYRVIFIAAAATVAAIVGATSGCIGNSAVSPLPTDTVCQKGALLPGDSISNTFVSTNGCRIVDLFSGETTFANSYTVALTKGKGYLISMGSDSLYYLRPSLELVNSKTKLIAYDTYYFPQEPVLTFVADSTVGYTVRAATEDTLAGDFGTYFIRMQTCRVPVAPLLLPTDSVTHGDDLAPTDCLMPPGNFNANDSSRVHLYSAYFSATLARTLYYSSSTPLVIVAGPTYDTFASLPHEVAVSVTASTNGSLEFFPAIAGNYTIIVGTFGYTTSSTPYTLTIGAEHTPTSAAQRGRPPRVFSRGRKFIDP